MLAPVSSKFNQAYWRGGAAEKTYVFLQGNNLPQRLTSNGQGTPFTVAELGFGTGLNLLLAAHLAQQTATPLTYISYELHPLSLPELATIHQGFPPELQSLAHHLRQTYAPQPGWTTYSLATTTLYLYVGDAAAGLTTHPQPADAWFLDGFSPDINPAMWTAELMETVYALTTPGGSASTYSSARVVKDNLRKAGFSLKRLRGYPPKWHMLRATKA